MHWFELGSHIIGSPTAEGAREAAIRCGISPSKVRQGKVYEFETASKRIPKEDSVVED